MTAYHQNVSPTACLPRSGANHLTGANPKAYPLSRFGESIHPWILTYPAFHRRRDVNSMSASHSWAAAIRLLT